MGFYTARFVDAPDAELAARTVVEEFKRSPECCSLLEAISNSEEDPPTVTCEKVEEVLPGAEVEAGPMGLAFYSTTFDEPPTAPSAVSRTLIRLRLLRGLDSLFRHYLLISFSPLVGGLVAMVIASLLWPELPKSAYGYGLAGMVGGTCIAFCALRLAKFFLHQWVIRRLDSQSG